MKQMKVNEKNFTTYISNMCENTLNFEKSSKFTSYVAESSIKGGTSLFNLYLIDSIIIDEIVPYLKSVSDVKLYNENDEYKYRQRPMVLSKDIYGYIDYWYIILAVNNYLSPYEFKGFKKLYIPDQSVIEELINKKLYKDKTVGIDNAS
jgi:hypothetical protein